MTYGKEFVNKTCELLGDYYPTRCFSKRPNGRESESFGRLWRFPIWSGGRSAAEPPDGRLATWKELVGEAQKSKTILSENHSKASRSGGSRWSTPANQSLLEHRHHAHSRWEHLECSGLAELSFSSDAVRAFATTMKVKAVTSPRTPKQLALRDDFLLRVV